MRQREAGPKRVRRLVWAAALAVVGAAGCAGMGMGAGSAAMGDSMAGMYDMVLSGNGGQYQGWLRLDDAESGALAVTSPITVNETAVQVARTDGGYTFTAPYTVEQNGCSGTLRLSGTDNGMGGFSGSGTLDDECVGEVPLEFTLSPR